MKTKFHLLSLLFLTTCFWSADLKAQSDIQFGAKAGFNVSSLGGSDLYSYSVKPGFHIGGVADIPFSDVINLQPEVLLSLQGSGWDFDDNLNLFYLNIPVMVKYNVWDELNIEAGPYLGLLLGNNVDDDFFLNDPETNSLDLGLGAGAGYRLNENFYFQARINVGFINAIKDFNSKNRVFQVSAVYFL